MNVEERYLKDWSGLTRGVPCVVHRPVTTDEVAALVRHADQQGLKITIQGGLTGLAGGAVPADGDVVINMERMNRIESIDAVEGVMQVQAGATLQQVQEAAAEAGWFFPVDLGARGSCQVGGNAATNAGGSQVVTTRQSNIGGVQSQASTYAYDYGDLRAVADGVANHVSVSNQDVWVEIDNSQFNSGGVSVQAELTAHNGYDAYVGANAAGNSVTGYACSDCGGILNANTTQTNNGNVSATAVTNIGGQGRAVITGTTATGNTASFYVTRPGG